MCLGEQYLAGSHTRGALSCWFTHPRGLFASPPNGFFENILWMLTTHLYCWLSTHFLCQNREMDSLQSPLFVFQLLLGYVNQQNTAVIQLLGVGMDFHVNPGLHFNSALPAQPSNFPLWVRPCSIATNPLCACEVRMCNCYLTKGGCWPKVVELC